MKKSLMFLCTISILFLCACTGGKKIKSTPTATPTEIPTVTPTMIPTATKIIPSATPTLLPTETAIPTITPTPRPYIENPISGINLGPYLYDDPNMGATVSESDLRALIERIEPYTYWIRTYGTENGLENAGAIAHDLGLNIAVGAWLSSDLAANESQMNSLIEMAENGDVDLAIIGNETLLRGDLTERELMIYINWFKQAVPYVEVTTSDVWSEIEKYPDLIEAMDVVAVNVYPYWDNVSIDKAASAIEDWYLNAMNTVNSISPDKEIIIAETGWPSCGKNGDPASTAAYFNSFTSFAQALDIQFFWFEAYDEQWKVENEGEAGACWGLWDGEGNMKPGVEDTFSGIFDESNADPNLMITHIPPLDDSFADLEGIALHVNPDDYRVIVYIYVPGAGGWWIKPTLDYPYTEIDAYGYWSTAIFTGGIDDQATRIAAFLVPYDYEPPAALGWSSLPQALYSASVSEVEINR
ncbi:MAG: hypothetical protein GYA18_02360 [Chloroflexi bacterium]|nr:hypothetical protein [Chloroflexota bacterium]